MALRRAAVYIGDGGVLVHACAAFITDTSACEQPLQAPPRARADGTVARATAGSTAPSRRRSSTGRRRGSARSSSPPPTAVGVDIEVILTPPCIFCLENCSTACRRYHLTACRRYHAAGIMPQVQRYTWQRCYRLARAMQEADAGTGTDHVGSISPSLAAFLRRSVCTSTIVAPWHTSARVYSCSLLCGR